MKSTIAFHITWIFVGCILGEAAFMAVQICLSLMTFDQSMTLHDLLSPDNPLYAIPPHFMIVGTVFVAAIIYAEFRHYYQASYYVLAAVLAAILYFISLWMGGMALSFGDTIVNLIAAVVSGFVYWWITPRRYNRHTLNTY